MRRSPMEKRSLRPSGSSTASASTYRRPFPTRSMQPVICNGGGPVPLRNIPSCSIRRKRQTNCGGWHRPSRLAFAPECDRCKLAAWRPCGPRCVLRPPRHSGEGGKFCALEERACASADAAGLSAGRRVSRRAQNNTSSTTLNSSRLERVRKHALDRLLEPPRAVVERNDGDG